MARENPAWGYDRIVGSLSNLGLKVSDQTVGDILRRHGILPAPKRARSTTWRDFIAAQYDGVGRCRFFTSSPDVASLITYYVLFFLHLETARQPGRITRHPTEEWMCKWPATRLTSVRASAQHRYVLHDRDTKFALNSGRHWQQEV